MRQGVLFGLGLLSLNSAGVAPQALSIDHQPVACAVAEKFPRFDARFTPVDSVAVARVLFQGETKEWYAVAMKAEGPAFTGVLPKPKKSLKAFRYYIEVTDKSLGTGRTAEYTTSVVDSSSACNGRVMAGALTSAAVILQGPTGLAALPAGFASSGVVAAGSAAGSATGAAGGAVGAGGGIGATALVLGGLAAAGGVVAVTASKGGGNEPSASSSPPNGRTIYNLAFLPSPPGLDVVPCGATPPNTQASGWSLNVSAAGEFDDLWNPGVVGTAPAILRIKGAITPTSVQGVLSCTNGALTGSMSATGSSGTFTGTFDFGASHGQIRVTRQ